MRRSRGVGLIELLIASGLLLGVMALGYLLFAQSLRRNSFLQEQAERMLAFQDLAAAWEQDARMAGTDGLILAADVTTAYQGLGQRATSRSSLAGGWQSFPRVYAFRVGERRVLRGALRLELGGGPMPVWKMADFQAFFDPLWAGLRPVVWQGQTFTVSACPYVTEFVAEPGVECLKLTMKAVGLRGDGGEVPLEIHRTAGFRL